MRSAIEASELFVEPSLLARLERMPVLRPALRRRLGLALAGPAPREHAQDGRGAEDAGERQQPGEQIEAVPLGRGEDPLAPLVDELPLDLAASRASLDAPLDVDLDPLCRGRVRLRQRLALADRAHQ